MKKLFNEYWDLALLIVWLLFMVWLLNRPCLVAPLSSRDCFCTFYKEESGEYPPLRLHSKHDHIE